MIHITEVANTTLDLLCNDHRDRSISTGDLLWKVRTTDSKFQGLDHADFRAMLLRLQTLGWVTKTGVGKFHWKIFPGVTKSDWNRNYPFRKREGHNVDSGYTTPKPIIHTHTPTPQTPTPNGNGDVAKYGEALRAAVTAIAQNAMKLEGVQKDIVDLDEKTKKLEETVKAVETLKQSFVKTLEIKRYDGKTYKLKDKVLPKVFEDVLALARCRRNILLVGPAGCGKTYLAELVAKSLGLDFGSLSCTAGMSETHLLGRSVPDLTHGKNRFQSTAFLKIYEEGGLFLLDELDAADPNLLLSVNTALANSYCNVPNRPDNPTAKKHDDFVCVGTANTYGRGATRQYAGRNQLDEATVDRFRMGLVECDYDEAVELAVCPDGKLREALQQIRTRINKTGVRRIMSTRFMQDAYVMVKEGGWTHDKCVDVFFSGWTDEEKAKVKL